MSVLLIAMLLAGDTVNTSVDPGAAQAAAPKKEKRICKDDPSYTGSRMKRKLCLTEIEWEKRDARGVGNFGTSGSTSSARTQ